MCVSMVTFSLYHEHTSENDVLIISSDHALVHNVMCCKTMPINSSQIKLNRKMT